MKTHSYNPHISQDISGFELRMYENPDLITHPEQVNSDPLTLRHEYKLDEYTGCWDLDREKQTLVFRWTSITNDSPSYAKFDFTSTWNAIVPFKLVKTDSDEIKTYLSMLYWDTPIKAMGAKFKHLRLKYSATSKVSADATFVDIPSDYAYHVELAGTIGTSSEERHSYLDNRTYRSDSKVPSPSPSYSNVRLTSGNLSAAKIESVLGADDFDFRCIDYSKSYDYIMTSKDLGLIGVKGNTAYFSNGSMNLPRPNIDNEEYKFYFYGQQVLVCYYPNLFKCYYTWINNYVKEENGSETVSWEDWRLLGEETEKFKVIIPEFFNILPLAIIYLDKEWRILHVMDFNTADYLRNNKTGIGNAPADFPILGTCILPTLEEFMKDTSGDHLRNWLYNDMDGYDKDVKDRLVRYWSSQIYISLQTFIQCLRFFPEYDKIEVLNCGCLCSSVEKRSVFIPYSPVIESSSRTVSMRSIPENSKVDNLVYYIPGKPNIYSLVNGDKKSARKNIKQICNGVILYV